MDNICIDYKDYSTRFKFIRKYKDPVLGECILLKDAILNRTVISQEKAIRSPDQFEKEQTNCEFLAKLNSLPNITKFYGYTCKLSPNSGRKACIFYHIREHLELDLEREVYNRIKKKAIFSEEEIWKMLQNIVSILFKLQLKDCPHGNIRPRTILISKEEDYKINWGHSHQLAYHQLLLRNLALDAKSCLSPELLKAYAEKNTKPNYNPYLSDVFSLGMTALYICTLGDIEDVYNWINLSINTQRLNSKLHSLKTIYSEKIVRIIEKMVKIDANERPDFWTLEAMICQAPHTRRTSSNISEGHTPKKAKHSPHKKTPTRREFKMEPGGELFPTYTILEPEKKLASTPSRGTPNSKRNLSVSTRGHSNTTSLTPNRQTRRNEYANSSNDSTSRSPVKNKKEAPYLLKRNFSPVKNFEYRSNESVLRELQDQIVFEPGTENYREGVIVRKFSDGSRYEGSIQGRLREGFGIYYFVNGDIYAGEWKNDKFSGRGVCLMANGERYEGMLVEGLKHGRGAYYYSDRNKYLGEWENDKKDGKGAFFFYATNEVYEGDWKDGDRNGCGTFYFASGDKFVGNWINGEKVGKGTIQYSNGAKFEGEWKQNKPNGSGEMIYANGDKYQGNWENGLKAGSGIYFYNDGSKYNGQWENDDKEGYGEFYYTKGDKYSGEWSNGVKHGHGTYYYKDGGNYDGEWENDLKHGNGTLELSDGTRYEGTWKNGERSGKGKMVLPNGDNYEGDFENDMMHGSGIYKWKSGDVYDGQWSKNMMHGEGVFTSRKGEKFKGTWNHQKLVKAVNIK